MARAGLRSTSGDVRSSGGGLGGPGRRLPAALAALCLLSSTLTDASPAHAAESLLLAVVNGHDTGAVLLIEEEPAPEESGEAPRLLALTHELRDLKIRADRLPSVTREGRAYTVLGGAPGIGVRLDRLGQRLLLDLDPELREVNALALGAPPSLSPQIFSAFLDYDAYAETYRGDRRAGGLFDLGVSDDWGLLSSSGLYRTDLGAVRLDSAYLRDLPEAPARFIVGDAISRGGAWGRPARFGGIQITRAFGLQPANPVFAGPALEGQADLPSTVEVYVDNVMRYRADVQPGPFSLQRLPIVTGGGEARVVVRDVLGRERVISAPFYSTPRVLAEGVDDYAVQIGALRRDWGLRSFAYGTAFASGFYRRGTPGGTTVEVAAETARDSQLLGGGFAVALPRLGELEVNAAASRGRGFGWLLSGSYRYAARGYAAGLNYERTSKDFAELGRSSLRPTVEQIAASASARLGGFGSLSGSLALRREAGEGQSAVGALTHGLRITENLYLTTSAVRDFRAGDTTVAAFLTVPLGGGTVATAEARRAREGNGGAVAVQHSPVNGLGLGYRARQEIGWRERSEAGLSWDGGTGSTALELERTPGGSAARGSAAGSLVLADESFFLTRKSRAGRALVRVPGQSGVTVYSHNRPAGTIGGDGRALVPDLLPYEENRIAVAVNELPFEASIGNDTVTVIPPYRGTALVDFEVRTGGGAMVAMRLPDGRPLPPGLRLTVEEPAGTAIAGMDGTVFVSGARHGTRLIAAIDGIPCTAVIGPFEPDGPLPLIGPVTCAP
ncbi:fimbria/pilus outer membrane usher protein [Azospirillum sp. SYSU D00513]|uniref:fimbria/pilus outer membrane usher protein n=1 Tax=Azospirillum sp. SYSU D00513 TaxID=2812561 RepID=UPI001A96AE96|nr:fimbria/pilus outer membrane usher protein [Azospirillum sp. SYSU D00513]